MNTLGRLALFIGVVFFGFQSLDATGQSFAPKDVCLFESKTDQEAEILRLLIKKLMYTEEEFCSSERISDVFKDYRYVYSKEDDQDYYHMLYVISYFADYSCEYRFNLERGFWSYQKCYNTFSDVKKR